MTISQAGRNLLIGVGNPDRGDDAAGPYAARLARRSAPAGLAILEAPADAAALMELWTGADTVFIVDAAVAAGPPGRIHRFDAIAAPIPAEFHGHSTHAFGLSEAIELGRALGELPRRLIVYAIIAEDFDCTAPISRPIHIVVGRVVRCILAEWESLAARPGVCITPAIRQDSRPGAQHGVNRR